MNSNDFRKLAHLVEQIGYDRFRRLIDSDNTGKVKEFCDKIRLALPDTMFIGDRDYGILCVHKGDEEYVDYRDLASRAKAAPRAYLGKQDALYILEHQADIPAMLRGYEFVFSAWSESDSFQQEYITWSRHRRRWEMGKSFDVNGWDRKIRILCRKD